jgi:hypothetical protein
MFNKELKEQIQVLQRIVENQRIALFDNQEKIEALLRHLNLFETYEHGTPGRWAVKPRVGVTVTGKAETTPFAYAFPETLYKPNPTPKKTKAKVK